MTPQEWFMYARNDYCDSGGLRPCSDCIIEIMGQIQEECAKVADEHECGEIVCGSMNCAMIIAAAIREKAKG